MINCPNCGAVIENDNNKCPYCGTLYFDMTAIDFTDRKPIYVKLRFHRNGKEIILTQKCVPSIGEIIYEPDGYEYDNHNRLCHEKYPTVVQSRNLHTNICFETILDTNNTLYTINY